MERDLELLGGEEILIENNVINFTSYIDRDNDIIWNNDINTCDYTNKKRSQLINSCWFGHQNLDNSNECNELTILVTQINEEGNILKKTSQSAIGELFDIRKGLNKNEIDIFQFLSTF